MSLTRRGNVILKITITVVTWRGSFVGHIKDSSARHSAQVTNTKYVSAAAPPGGGGSPSVSVLSGP